MSTLATQIAESGLLQLSALAFIGGLVWWCWTMTEEHAGPRRRARAFVFGIGFVLLIAILNQPKTPGPSLRSQCRDRLKHLGLALQNYYNVNKQFPPVMTVDRNGSPLHSWRTLLTRYLEGENFMSRLSLNEPWNSPTNSAVFQQPNEFIARAIRMGEIMRRATWQ